MSRPAAVRAARQRGARPGGRETDGPGAAAAAGAAPISLCASIPPAEKAATTTATTVLRAAPTILHPTATAATTCVSAPDTTAAKTKAKTSQESQGSLLQTLGRPIRGWSWERPRRLRLRRGRGRPCRARPPILSAPGISCSTADGSRDDPQTAKPEERRGVRACATAGGAQAGLRSACWVCWVYCIFHTIVLGVHHHHHHHHHHGGGADKRSFRRRSFVIPHTYG